MGAPFVGGDQAQHGGGGQAHYRGQAVHAVDQVQGIYAADKPENGYGYGQGAKFDPVSECDNLIDAVSGQGDGQNRAHLHGELESGVQPVDVVDQAQTGTQNSPRILPPAKAPTDFPRIHDRHNWLPGVPRPWTNRRPLPRPRA